METSERTETIQSLLKGMVTASETRRYISKYEGLVSLWELEPLKRGVEKSEDSYKILISQLGGIPIRLTLSNEEEIEARVIALDSFRDGQWLYRYMVGDTVADTLGCSTPEELMDAFNATLPQPEEFHSE